MAFTFLHCADLHLGCAQYNLSERYEDFFSAFLEIVRVAIERKADALLIAGDLFHHRSIDAETLLRASAILRTLKDAGIAVVSVEGNHDKAYYLERQSWQEYLCAQELMTLLKPSAEPDWSLQEYDGKKGAVLESDGCRVVGLGYLGGSTRQRLEELSASLEPCEKPTVALLHAAIEKLMGQDMAGVSREALAPYAGKVDYFAMGHLHTRTETADWAYNPGAPECVHIDEGKRGEKGCYFVELEKTRAGVSKKVEYIPIPRRKVLFLRVDLTEVAIDAVQPRILAQAKKEFAQGAQGALVSVSLCGQPSFSVSSVDARALEAAIVEALGCLYAEVDNEASLLGSAETGGSFDRAALEEEAFFKLAQEIGAPDAQRVAKAAAALKTALLSGEKPEAMLDYLNGEAEQCASNP